MNRQHNISYLANLSPEMEVMVEDTLDLLANQVDRLATRLNECPPRTDYELWIQLTEWRRDLNDTLDSFIEKECDGTKDYISEFPPVDFGGS